MAKSTRLVKSFTRLLLPIVLLVLVAVSAGAVWLVYKTAHPLKARYLVTPEKYGQLSTRAAQVTEETWANRLISQRARYRMRTWLLLIVASFFQCDLLRFATYDRYMPRGLRSAEIIHN